MTVAPYVGRFGWVNVDLDALDPEIVREIVLSAWRRTAPKAVVADSTRAPGDDVDRATSDRRRRRHERHRRRAPDRRGLRQRPGTEGRAALIPYVVAGYPDADTSLEIALAAADAGADLLEVGLPYSDPLADGATLQRASQVAIRAGATLEGSLRLIERIGAARPDLPVVPMGYANQVIGGGDGEAVARRLAASGAAGLIVADLTPDEGAPVRGGRPRRRPGGRLPRRPDHAARNGAPSRSAQRRVPLLRLAGRRDRCPHRLCRGPSAAS